MSTRKSRLAAKKNSKIEVKQNPKSTPKRNFAGEKRSQAPSNNSSRRLEISKNVADSNLLQCEVCFLEFSCKYNLQRHLGHFNGARYPCAECGTKFADKKQLKIHFSCTHIVKIVEHGFRCDVCGQQMKNAVHLQAHLYHYHDSGLQTPRTKKIGSRGTGGRGNNNIVEEQERPAEYVAEEIKNVRAGSLERSEDNKTTKNSEATIPDTSNKCEGIRTRSKGLGRHLRFNGTTVLRARPENVDGSKAKKIGRSGRHKSRRKTKRDKANCVEFDDRLNKEVEHSSLTVPTLEEDLGTLLKGSMNTNESENREKGVNETLKNNKKIANFRKLEVDNDHLENRCPADGNELHGLTAPEKPDNHRKNKFEIQSEQPVYDETDTKHLDNAESSAVIQIMQGKRNCSVAKDAVTQNAVMAKKNSKTLKALEKLDISIGEISAGSPKPKVVTDHFEASFADKGDQQVLLESSLHSRSQKSKIYGVTKKKGKDKTLENVEYRRKIENTDFVRLIPDARLGGPDDTNGPEISPEISRNAEHSRNTDDDRVLTEPILRILDENKATETFPEILKTLREADDNTRRIAGASIYIAAQNIEKEKSLEIPENSDYTNYKARENDYSSPNSLQKKNELRNSPQILRYLENYENTAKTAVIDDIYDSKEMRERHLIVSDELFVTSSKTSVDKKRKYEKPENRRPQVAKYKRAKFTAGIEKKGKKLTKDAVTELNSVLAEVVALFSEMDVILPAKNDERDEMPEILDNIGTAIKILDYSIVSDNLQNNDSTFRFDPEMRENVEPREKSYFKMSSKVLEDFNDETQSPSMENGISKNGGEHLVTMENIDKYDGGSFSGEHPKPGITRPVFSETKIDDGNEGASPKNSPKCSNHEEPEKTSIFCKKTIIISEKMLEKNIASEIVGSVKKSENVRSSLIVDERRVETPDTMSENYDSSKHIRNSENTVRATIMNGKSVWIGKNSQEIEKSYKNYPNFLQTKNTDRPLVISSGIDEWPEGMDNPESSENFDEIIVRNIERKSEILQNNKAPSVNSRKAACTDKMDVIRDTDIIASEITQTGDKKCEYQENGRESENTEKKRIMDYTGDNIRKKIGGNDESIEHFRNIDYTENTETGLGNHKTRVKTLNRMYENIGSFANFENIQPIKNPDNTRVTVDQSTPVIVKPKSKNGPSKTSKNHIEIENVDDNTSIIINNNVSFIEKTMEVCKPLEHFQNFEKIGDMNESVGLITNVNVPKQTSQNNESSGNSHILRNSENAAKTAGINDTSVADLAKVQKTNISFKNLQYPEKIENSDTVFNDINVDSYEKIQKIEKPSNHLYNKTEESDNTIVIKDPIVRVRGKIQQHHEPLNKMESRSIELNNIPPLTTDTSFSAPEAMHYECFDNLQNVTEMTKEDTTFTINDHPGKNRLAKIIGRVIASSKTSPLSLSKFANLLYDTVLEPVDNHSKAYDRKKSESERDNELRARYSCKHCYVSVTKINIENNYVRERRNSIVGMSEKLSINSSSMSWHCPYRVCEATFLSEASATKHIIDCHTIVRSVICDKVLSTVSSMRRHYRESHSVGCDEKNACACGKSMNGYEALEGHFFQHALRSCVSTTLPPFVGTPCQPSKKTEICITCGKDFWLKTCLELHSLECDKASLKSLRNASMRNPLRRTFSQGQIVPNDLMCRVCYAEFPTSAALWKHEKIYAKPANHRCSICGTRFMEKHLLDGHTRAAHTFNLVVDYCCYCVICDQGFTKEIYRLVHMMHIHGEKYPTDVMKSSTLYNRSAADEDNTDGVSGEECQICDLVFVNRKRFIEHAIFYKNDEIVVCKICNQQFAGQYKAHRHNKLCHYSASIRDAYPHKCLVCQEGFAFKRHLKAHISHIHGKNVDLINLMYPPRNDVDVKEGPAKDRCEGTSSGVDRLHICAICEASFPTIDLLTAHRVEYGDDGEYVCMRCGKKCGTATLLLDHLSLNHSSTIYDSVKCHRCDENFLTPAAWISHIKHYHVSDTREPSEFYLEINLAATKEFGVNEFELIPKNIRIANGSAYELIRSSLNGQLLGNVTADTQNETAKKRVSIVNSSNINVVTSGVDITHDTDIEIIEETAKISGPPKIITPGPSKKKNNWHCDICTTNFRGPADFSMHKARYANVGPHVCELCTRRFTSIKIYQEHKAEHDDDPRRGMNCRYFCAMCNQRFNTLTWLEMHNAHLHEKTGKIFKTDMNSCVQRIVVTSSTTHLTNPSRTLAPYKAACSTVARSKANAQTIRPQKLDQPIIAMPSSSKTADITHKKMLRQPITLREAANNTPSYIYQCPNCTGQYFNFQQLREHFRFIHKVPALDKIEADGHTKTGNNVNVVDKVPVPRKVHALDPIEVSSEPNRTAIADNNSPTNQLSITSAQHVPTASNTSSIINSVDSQTSVVSLVTQKIGMLSPCGLSLNSSTMDLQGVQTDNTRSNSGIKILTDEKINNGLLVGKMGRNIVPTNAVWMIPPPSSLPGMQFQSNIPMRPLQRNSSKAANVIKTLSSDSPALVRCEPCDFFFPSMTMLRLHQGRVHTASSPDIKCIAMGNVKDRESSVLSMHNAPNRCPMVADSLPVFQGTEKLPISSGFEGSSPDTQHMPLPLDKAELRVFVPLKSLSVQDGQLPKAVGKRKHDPTSNRKISAKKVKRKVLSVSTYEQLRREHNVEPASKSGKKELPMIDLT